MPTANGVISYIKDRFILSCRYKDYDSKDGIEWIEITKELDCKLSNIDYINSEIIGISTLKKVIKLDTYSMEELKNNVSELNSALVDTPVWVVPTQMNGRCSITGGGYYTRGKKVCVQLTITTLVDLTGGDYRTMFAGLPIADGNRSVAISCAIFNAGFAISGYINSAGALCINAPNTITKGSEIIITGNYYSA